MTHAAPAVLIGALCLAPAAPTSAEDLRLSFQTNGAGVCQAALPSFEGLVRKRPLAIQNEGASDAFVTCSATSVQWLAMHPELPYSVTFQNTNAAARSVSCTAVAGSFSWPSEYSTNLVSVPGSGGVATMYFSAGQLPQLADNRAPFNLSCRLPPGVGLSTVYVSQVLRVAD